MNRQLFCMAAALCLVLSLGACGAPSVQESLPPASTSSVGSVDSAGSVNSAEDTVFLADIYGDDYVSFVTDTLTMQMENRMEKTPERVYFPVQEQKPLSDYVTIDETTEFYVNEDGNTVVVLPAGSVTDADAGIQEFIVPKP